MDETQTTPSSLTEASYPCCCIVFYATVLSYNFLLQYKQSLRSPSDDIGINGGRTNAMQTTHSAQTSDACDANAMQPFD